MPTVSEEHVNYIIRTLCWHTWTKWSKPFTGTWVHPETDDVKGYMSQRRTCTKCGKTSYRKCK